MERFQLQFVHWNHQDNTIVFDILPIEALIDQGTDHLVNQFLQDIGLDNVQVVKWQIVPYRSPYYTTVKSSTHWQDRYPLMWHVKIRLNYALENISLSPVTIYFSDAYDESWLDFPELDRWDTVSCLMIFDAVQEKRNQLTALFAREQFRQYQYTVFELGHGLIQFRFKIGKIDFEQQDRFLQLLIDNYGQVTDLITRSKTTYYLTKLKHRREKEARLKMAKAFLGLDIPRKD